MSDLAASPVITAARAAPRMRVLRFVIAVAALGHLVVGLSFWFAPELLVDEILAWGPPSGWTSILGAYDLSVAFGLYLAFRDPVANTGILKFVGVLLLLHAGTHAYYIVWGDAPARFWFVTGYLALGGIVLLWLAPRQSSSSMRL